MGNVRWILIITGLTLITSGCASYVTPGAAVNLTDIDRADIREVAEKKPSPNFPARIAAIRIQASDYRSFTSQGIEGKNFSVVVPDELATDDVLTKVLSWPSVTDVAPINRLLLPPTLASTDDLRLAAAKLQADVLLLYTIETNFRMQGKIHQPLAILSLGLAPDRDARVTATASALFIDVRTGFIYGLGESKATAVGLTNFWSTAETIDHQRLVAEQDAFTQMVGALGKTWARIARQYAGSPAMTLAIGSKRSLDVD